MESKNKIYGIYDVENKIWNNAFLAMDDNIALAVIKDQINKNIKVIKLSKNANEIANIEVFLENQKNYELIEIATNKKVVELKSLIPTIKNEK